MTEKALRENIFDDQHYEKTDFCSAGIPEKDNAVKAECKNIGGAIVRIEGGQGDLDCL